MECLKDSDVKRLEGVMGKLTKSLYYAARNVSRDKIVIHACCALHKSYEEIPQAIATMCAPKPTSPETISFFKGLIKKVVGDILEMGCGRFSSLEYCDSNLMEGMAQIRSLVTREDIETPKTSFIVPLMEFITMVYS